MKILVFGHSGQVATELRRLGGNAIEALDREAADLGDPAACAARIEQTDAGAIINAAAFTAVDRAETQEALATTINGTTPAAMALAAAARDLPFVQISTDYVFDGSGTALWHPADAAAPLGAYGRSKLAGEEGVRAAHGRYAILRTAWVFSAHGANFVKTMLRLGATRDRLSIVADQLGGPTPAADIAAACLSIAARLRTDPALSGTYHFAGAPDVSWADFARAILARAGLSCPVTDIATADYPTPAQRPLNSRLDCTTTEEMFGIPRPDWQAGLALVLDELHATKAKRT